MNTNEIRDIVTTLLDATYNTVGEDGLLTGFMLGRNDGRQSFGGISVTLFIRRKRLMPAAVKLRMAGPVHLRYFPLGHSLDLLRSFLCDRYHIVAASEIFSRAETSLLERISEADVNLLVEEFANSDLLNPVYETCLFPLITVQVDDTYDGSAFAFSSCRDHSIQRDFADLPSGYINGETYPPFANWQHATQAPSSWLLVNAPSSEVGKRLK